MRKPAGYLIFFLFIIPALVYAEASNHQALFKIERSKNANIIQTKICSALNRWQKASSKPPRIVVDLPAAVAAMATLPERLTTNARMLGNTPNAVRMRMRQLGQFAQMKGCRKVIVEEAGGRFTDLTGNATTDGGNAVATNGLLHDEVLGLLSSPPASGA